MNNTNKVLLTPFLSMLLISATQANDILDKIYISAHSGYASSNINTGEVQNAFDKEGLNATVLSVDDSRYGYGLGVGYAITPKWSTELNYLDLGQVKVKFSSPDAIKTLEKVHPESGNGLTLSGIYRYALNDNAHFRVRAGLFNWYADYKTTNGAGNPTTTDSYSGTNFYWGLGFGYRISNSLNIITEIQRFEFENQETNYLRLGLEW
ncbi:MAG: hypothetical protein ACI935_002977 [Moritella dasanensis]|jgi:hypothetical protein